MAIGLRCLTSKVMARVPVADWRTDWVVSTIIEAVRECYPLTADDSFVSTYDKWAALYKSMQKTNTVDQLLQASISKVFTHLSNPSKEFRGKRLFQLDLNDALRKAAAYTTNFLNCSRPRKWSSTPGRRSTSNSARRMTRSASRLSPPLTPTSALALKTT